MAFRTRPKVFEQQLAKAREELRDFRLPDRTLNPEDYSKNQAYVLFQKRRISIRRVISFLRSNDFVLRKLAQDFISKTDPKDLKKYLSYDELKTLFYSNYDNFAVLEIIFKSILLFDEGPEFIKNYILDMRHTPGELSKLLILLSDNNKYIHILDYCINARQNLKSWLPKGYKGIKHEKAPQVKSEKELLLGEKEPLLASTNLRFLTAQFEQLAYIAEQLSKKYGSRFIGIVVYGSQAKGYSIEASDLDFAIICNYPDIMNSFNEYSKEFKLNIDHVRVVSTNLGPYDSKDIAVLFRGLFFGNKTLLKQTQKNIFSKLNPHVWEAVRMNMYREESNLYKAFDRFNLGPRERQRILAKTALRVPPKYDEMKRILGIN